jgi:hypothetical protein
LIYVDSSKSWHRIDACLWETAAPIPGKKVLSGEYGDLKNLFVTKLDVKTPNLQMVVAELEALSGSDPPVQEVIALIRALNAMNPRPGDLSRLKSLNILPVKKAGEEQVCLRSTAFDFIILDHPKLANGFQGRLLVLDFSLEEIKQLRPFLSAMSLNDKYISVRVSEQTEAQDGVVNQNLCTEFHKRAYAIVRYI